MIDNTNFVTLDQVYQISDKKLSTNSLFEATLLVVCGNFPGWYRRKIWDTNVTSYTLI